MKSPFLAFTMSFFLPGAGLCYLGKWTWGFVNFAVVLFVGVIAALALSDEALEKYMRYLAIACGGGSGGLAMSLAQQMSHGKKNGRASPPRESGRAESGAAGGHPCE
jgi:hypothetical protein